MSISWVGTTQGTFPYVYSPHLLRTIFPTDMTREETTPDGPILFIMVREWDDVQVVNVSLCSKLIFVFLEYFLLWQPTDVVDHPVLTWYPVTNCWKRKLLV